MSYHKDLDEYFEEDLENEIARRRQARRTRLCDYCGRAQSVEPPCKFPRRHRGLIERPVDEIADKMRAKYLAENAEG